MNKNQQQNSFNFRKPKPPDDKKILEKELREKKNFANRIKQLLQNENKRLAKLQRLEEEQKNV